MTVASSGAAHVVSVAMAAIVAIAVAVISCYLWLQIRVRRGELTPDQARASTRRFAAIFAPLAVVVIALANIAGR